MGHSYRFLCRQCGFVLPLYEGYAFMVHNLRADEFLAGASVASLHYKTLGKMNELLADYPDLWLHVEYQVYRCRLCQKVSDRLFVQLTDGEKVLHQTRFKCSSCRVRLKHTNIHRLKHAVCPRCGSAEFKKEKELVLWG